MSAYESLLNIYRVFCQPTSFAASTSRLGFRQRAGFMVRTAPLMLAVMAVTAGALSVILHVIGLPFHWSPKGAWWGPSLLSLGAGVVVGIAWNVSMGVAAGTIWGPAHWLIGSVVLPLLPGVPEPTEIALAITLPLGLAIGVGLGAAGTTSRANAAWGTAGGVVLGLTIGRYAPIPWSIGWLASFIGGYFRLEWYALDVEATLVSLLRARRHPEHARSLFRSSPIYWREPIWLPLPGLRAFLRLIAEHDSRAALEECLFVILERPSQARTARAALIEITAGSLASLDTIQQIAAAADQLRGGAQEGLRLGAARARLPELLDTVIPAFETLAHHAEQHLAATLPHNRRRALERLRDGAQDLGRTLALDRSAVARAFATGARRWREVAEARLAEMGQAEEAAGYVYNPFVFGQPIEETDSNLFVGRRDVVREIEVNLLGSAEKPTLVLWGPRRMGKTSVLLQLPRLLGPQFSPAFVDMQAMGARENLSAFFTAITAASANGLRRRGIEAAPLAPDGLADAPFGAFSHWLEEVEGKLGPDRYLVLCLDEFERLERSIQDGRLPSELMDEIRHIIQHHPRVVLLFAGSHRPDEMALNWPDALISTRLIRVSYLNDEEARQLITRPTPDFPVTYHPDTVTGIMAATRCQPYLVQAVCFELVNALNLAGRREAQPQDVTEAVDAALDSTRLYFAEMWRQLGDSQRKLLGALAHADDSLDSAELTGLAGAAPEHTDSELRSLELRSVVEKHPGGWRLQVPMVKEWVRTRSA